MSIKIELNIINNSMINKWAIQMQITISTHIRLKVRLFKLSYHYLYIEDLNSDGEGIDAAEFEHIAEIYDHIRNIHQQACKTQEQRNMVDGRLATYFDHKLK